MSIKKYYKLILSLALFLSACKGVEVSKTIPSELKKYVSELKVDPIKGAKIETSYAKLNENLYKVEVTLDLKKEIKTKSWSVSLNPTFKGDFHWTPHLSPSDEHIISDHVFRAPALISSSQKQIITLIPSLEDRANSKQRWYMDLNAETNTMTVGFANYTVAEHVLFKKAKETVMSAGKHTMAFYLMVDNKKEAIQNPWRAPLKFMWEKYGKKLAKQGEPIKNELGPYVEKTYNWAFNTWKDAVWQEFELNGKKVGAPVFIVNVTQSPNFPGEVNEREFRSIWNQSWFNSFRSSMGLYLYAKKTNNKDYLEKALMTKELALNFPQKNGLFPGLIATEMEQVEINGKKYNRSKGWGHKYFGNSNRNPYSWDPQKSPLHVLDMSTTALFMLQWYQDLEKDKRLLDYAIRYAEGLLPYQDAEGFFPAWITFDNKQEALPILAKSPETSKTVTFLLKLAELTKNDKYKQAALKAIKAVTKQIVPTGQWEDFETYWSCSRWGANEYLGKKIPRNNMFKQNTLSIYWTAEALLNCYELTGEKKYLELGQRTLDELLMAQAVWQPPYMYVTVYGGFGVMNADAEWNDSRQALFSELIIRYGKVLNMPEYVDRGVIALKASFSMMYCPENSKTREQWEKVYPFFNEKDYGFMMENYGHGGYTGEGGTGIGVFTIYDWGNGAASDAYNKIVYKYGKDIFKQ